MSFMSFIYFNVISYHFMSFQVSLDFSDQLSIKSGGRGRAGEGGLNMSSLMGRSHLRFGCAVWVCVSPSHAFSMKFLSF
jgi:hypothetical protein